ncbi:CheR family methyltransferase [Seohaeicola nanhaiensis]|uniref:Chemotaxis protein methyltransferase n=1 Tax=Seohaeicola nanhaiensis TaxID=1387282 RepID=A0ABV9KAF6_9RHOB
MSALNLDLPGGPMGRDVEYVTADFQRIISILHEVAGIKMPPTNEALVFSRLSRRVRDLGLNRFADYIAHVEAPQNVAERDEMVAALTTNTTRFFREDYHFETLASELLPGLLARAREGARIRLWSAGCSTGEEPYTIAAVVMQHCPDLAACDFRILATDINRRVLAIAERGEYPAACAEAVTPDLVPRMFETAGTDMVRIRPELRSLITFRYMNFMDPWPVSGPFDAIFCRNVMIYMEEDVQRRVWAGLASVMPPGGYLFIGHSERIGREFKDQLQLVGKTTFRRV